MDKSESVTRMRVNLPLQHDLFSGYSEDHRCQIVFHTEAIGGNSEEIARTSGSCHGDSTHGRGALALAYAKMMQTPIPSSTACAVLKSADIERGRDLRLSHPPFKPEGGSIPTYFT